MRSGGRILFVNLIAALLLSTASSFAQDSSGMVVAARGEVSVNSNGESRPLRQGDFIYQHDEITAGNRSFTVLQFMDGAKVTLRPDSVLIIEHYQFAGAEADAVMLDLVSGGLRVKHGAIAATQPEAFKIRTPLTQMSVSGAESSLTLCGENICDQQGLIEIPE
jgi:hypothetical protein